MLNYTALISYIFIVTFTPGPNNIMSMSNASKYGFKKSIPFNVGIFFGFFFVIALCSLFSVTLYTLLPKVKPVMTMIGAIYIIWLAWKIYKSDPSKEGKSLGDTNTLISGLLLQFLNPKVILYGITVVSTFIAPYYTAPIVYLIFSLILAAVGFVATISWSLFGSLFQQYLCNHRKLVNSVMSLLLVFCAISLFK